MDLFDSIEYPDRAGYRPPDPPDLRAHGITEIELDFETNGLEWHGLHRPIGVGYCLPDGTTGYLPYRHQGPGNLDESVVLRWMKEQLRNIHITNISTKFDIHMAYADGIDLEEQGCTVSDVAHYAALLDDHRKRFSLARLCNDLLFDEQKVHSVDGIELDGSRMAHYHPQIIAIRCEADCRQVQKLKKLMLPQLQEQNLLPVALLEDEVIFPVCEMERNAAVIDVELLKKYVQETYDETRRIILNIAGAFEMTFNPDKTSDWMKLFKHLKLPMPGYTEKGSPSFTDNLIRGIDNPWVQEGRRLNKITTLRSKFLISYLKRVATENLLRYNLQQLRTEGHGTVTGRFSSWDVNIQQVMRTLKQIETYGSDKWIIRRLFIPESGLFLTADASQIEYRLFAHYAQSEHILGAYRNNPELSFHQMVMDMLLQHDPNITYKRAKDINFAKVYGAAKPKIASMLFSVPLENVTSEMQKQSDAFVNIYDAEFPEVPRLLHKAQAMARSRGWVKTITGRRARFKRGESVHKALNRVIQGSAADINKRKLVELHNERKTTGFKMRFTVHDEVDGDIPDIESAHLVKEILNRQSYPTTVPILWDVEVGKNWAETHALDKRKKDAG